MSGYVIIVEFRLKPGTFESFRGLIAANARASVRDEPGCQRFDVMVPEGDSERVVLYEIYDDRAAFEAHRKTPHFAVFDAASRELIVDKNVRPYRLEFVG